MSKSDKELVRRSKHLSLVLRHDPAGAGLVLDTAGWVDVVNLLPAVKLTMEQLEEVVGKNDKKRFEFNENKTRIRACQGHSVEVDLGYEDKEPPEFLFHGTSKDIVSTLLSEGLKPMDRHDVHLSSNFGTARIVAIRRKNPTVLVVSSGKMAKDGYKFRLSNNGVWLAAHVPAKYLDIYADATT